MLDISKQRECSNAASKGKRAGRSWRGLLWGKQWGMNSGKEGRRGKVFSSSSCSLFYFWLFLFLFGLHALLFFLFFMLLSCFWSFFFCFSPNLIDNFDSVAYGLNSNVI